MAAPGPVVPGCKRLLGAGRHNLDMRVDSGTSGAGISHHYTGDRRSFDGVV